MIHDDTWWKKMRPCNMYTSPKYPVLPRCQSIEGQTSGMEAPQVVDLVVEASLRRWNPSIFYQVRIYTKFIEINDWFTPRKTNMTLERATIWRCISYQKRCFLTVMLVFGGDINRYIGILISTRLPTKHGTSRVTINTLMFFQSG